ncbi:nucleotidyltransferase family protein [Marinoscillum sp.]|uniref:nucleotidyltransferase family protein n=1 Tax=Marinoscillum sp. TaxID=2024838 RepID=UPI003BA8E673
MHLSESEIKGIKAICKDYRVKHLYAFGSILGDFFSPENDIDFLVEIDISDPYEYTDLYYGLLSELERFLDRRIDLLEVRASRNEFIQSEIDKSKVAIYG